MQDKPTVSELLEAVAAFIAEEAVPVLGGAKKFHGLVAANVLRVVAREYELAPAHLADERDALWRLLGKKGRPPASADLYQLVRDLNTELCERIEAGDGDQEPLKAKLLAYLRHDINARLAIDNPRFRR